VDEMLAAAALYTSNVRRRQSLVPIQKAFSDGITVAAALAAGKNSSAHQRSLGVREGGGVESFEPGWGLVSGRETMSCKGLGLHGASGFGGGRQLNTGEDLRRLGMLHVADAAGVSRELVLREEGVRGGFCMVGERMDLDKLKNLDLEGMFILRVLPDYGEAVGEVVAKEDAEDGVHFEINFENGMIEKLSLTDFALSLKSTMALARGNGWGLGAGGLAQRICPMPSEVAAARQDLLRDESSAARGAGGSGAGGPAVAAEIVRAGGWHSSRAATRQLNTVLLMQERAALHVRDSLPSAISLYTRELPYSPVTAWQYRATPLHGALLRVCDCLHYWLSGQLGIIVLIADVGQVQLNESVMCECNGSLLLGRICQLKPGTLFSPFCPLSTMHVFRGWS
jgi:hypothetical protein